MFDVFYVTCLLMFQLASLVVQRCADDGKNCQPCDPQNSACYRSVTFPAQ